MVEKRKPGNTCVGGVWEMGAEGVLGGMVEEVLGEEGGREVAEKIRNIQGGREMGGEGDESLVGGGTERRARESGESVERE